MPSETQARWPLFDMVSRWVRNCTAPDNSARGDSCLEASGEEAQRIRAHLRASPEDLRWLAGRDPGHSELLPHMLHATGIDESKLPENTRAALARTCGACPDKPHCADELAQGRAVKTYSAFCPNAPEIRKLRGE
jgi:hypothetical protein